MTYWLHLLITFWIGSVYLGYLCDFVWIFVNLVCRWIGAASHQLLLVGIFTRFSIVGGQTWISTAHGQSRLIVQTYHAWRLGKTAFYADISNQRVAIWTSILVVLVNFSWVFFKRSTRASWSNLRKSLARFDLLGYRFRCIFFICRQSVYVFRLLWNSINVWVLHVIIIDALQIFAIFWNSR